MPISARARKQLWSSVTLGALIACGPKSTPAPPPAAVEASVRVWWSPELALAQLAAATAELDKPLEEPLEMIKGGARPEQLATCRDYVRLRPQQYEPSDPTAWGWMHEIGSRCQSLIALERAKPSRDARVAELLSSPDLLRRLPADLAVAQSPEWIERRTSAARAGQTLAAFDPNSKIKEQNALHAEIESDDMTTKLDLAALGDFDGDGAQDALIKSLSYGTEGSWFDQRLLLIGGKGTEGMLAVLEEPAL